MGRPRVKPGEESVSVNVRLPQSAFDEFYRQARHMTEVEDREVSIAEAVRRYLAGTVNYKVYGDWDGRPPLDARFVDALLDYSNQEALDIAKESIATSKALVSAMTEAILEIESVWTAIQVAIAMDPSEGIHLLQRLIRERPKTH